MEERTIDINGKSIKVKEVLFVETFSENSSALFKGIGYAPTMLILATELTKEEVLALSRRDGFKLWKAYLEINEDADFQNPQD